MSNKNHAVIVPYHSNVTYEVVILHTAIHIYIYSYSYSYHITYITTMLLIYYIAI